MKKTIRIGTRGSKLALWQSNWVRTELMRRHPDIDVELVRIRTTGDKILDVPLARVGGKGLFVKEIEEALLDGRVDLAVHSMKDVPTVFPDGLHLRAVTEREDPRDALVCRAGRRLSELPPGATVGTSSLRRKAQLLACRGDLEVRELRGNIDTRLRKAADGVYDAVVLAGAGLRRMGWGERITEYLDVEVSLPAIGQGALGIETAVDNDYINDLTAFFDHADTSRAVRAERAFLARLEGGCQVPIAAYGEVKGERLRLRGLVASVDGSTVVRDSVEGPACDAESLGTTLAERLLSRGADRILEELYGPA
ncbi:MAG TPA: hydroxymethylbilane synthase [Deltaproteobacteria bacterium]|nr:hydroxymethylbilane synthase [Deltaproteobacteria bacterium]